MENSSKINCKALENKDFSYYGQHLRTSRSGVRVPPAVPKGVIRKDGSFLSFVVERGRVNVETGKRYGQRYVFYFRSSCGIADDNCLTTAGKLSIVVSGSGLYDGI